MSLERKQAQNEAAAGLMAVASAHSMLLHINGTVECIKSGLLQDAELSKKYDKGQLAIESERNVIAIAADYLTSFALRADGTVAYAGEKLAGIDKVKSLKNIKAIACGTAHFAALREDGTVFACGENDEGQCQVSGWSQVKKIFCGLSTTFGIREDGTVLACGRNFDDQCEVSQWQDVVSIFNGGDYTLGVKADGTVVHCGKMDEKAAEVISGWQDIVCVVGDTMLSKLIALKSDGKAICWDQYYDVSEIKSWKNLVAVNLDDSVYIGLQADGELLAVETSPHVVMDTTGGYRGKRLFENIDNLTQEREAAFAEEKARQEQAAAERKLQKEKEKKKKRTKKIVGTVCWLAAAAIVAFAIYYCIVLLPEQSYQKACTLEAQGDTAAAYERFLALGEYKDSSMRAREYQWDNVQVGSTLYYGRYEQDNDTENGKESITWRVLAVEDGKVLVISEKILDAVAFSEKDNSTEDWDKSSLRTWLNSTFLNEALTAEGQKRIIAHSNGDPISLLSPENAELYFDGDWERMAKRTAYAKAQGAERAWWWLTSGGVDWDGTVCGGNWYETLLGNTEKVRSYQTYGVRPIMWLAVEGLEIQEDTQSPAVTVTVTGNSVNLREGPGSSYSKIGKANKGDVLTIVEVSKDDTYTWGRFTENGGGWICLDYTDYK